MKKHWANPDCQNSEPKKRTVSVLANVEFCTCLNPKGCGGGPKVPGGFLIGCHFSQDHAMVTKILDFIHIHP